MADTARVVAWMFGSEAPAGAGREPVTIVFLPAGPPDTAWMGRVAQQEKGGRTVFLEPDGDSLRPHAYGTAGPLALAPADLDVAAAAAATHSKTPAGGEVTFSTSDGRQRVTSRVTDRPLIRTEISPSQALEAQRRVWNTDTVNGLVAQLRSAAGVIPFVGAGMSAGIRFSDPPDRFPQWSDLLVNLSAGTSIESEVTRLVGAGDYERAAKMVDDHRPGILPERIRDAFDRTVDQAQLVTGALSYLPFLTRGPVITTNFDRVLEQAFAASEQPFEEPPIPGPQPFALIRAIHQNRRVLLKIHGDCRDPTFRVFTVEEYERAYGVMSADGGEAPASRATIGSLAWLMFTNRPMLCLGCSLEEDRTTHVFRALRQQLPGLTHYAVLAAQYSRHRHEERTRQLDQMGMRALWYEPGQFGQIEAIVRDVLERASTRSRERRAAPSPPPGAPPPAPSRFLEAGAILGAAPDAAQLRPEVRLVARTLLEGNLAFFLGAYAHLGNLPLGDGFYEQLAEKFACPALAGDRSAIGAFIVSRHGAARLWQEVRPMIDPVPAGPSAVHRLLALLPSALREAKRPGSAPVMIFTTNYDTAMEEALTAAGERFHLLYYMGGTATRDEGLFAERAPDGSVRIIERPGNLRWLDPASSVVVKLNGGVAYDAAFDESVLIATSHFEQFAAHIPGSLPLHVKSLFRTKSLLFLGHGLAEPDVQALIRHSAPADRSVKSWAIQLPPADPVRRETWEERVNYLRGWGLQVVKSDLQQFLAALHRELAARLSTSHDPKKSSVV